MSALRHAFIQTEDEFLSECKDDDSGATVTVLLLDGTRFWCANAGDCRTLLYRDQQAIPLSQDHSFANEQEQNRVLELGAEFDQYHRILGKGAGLLVLRSLGDRLFDRNIVTARPEIIDGNLDLEKDAFLVLCSDGLTEKLTSKEICEFVRDRRKKEPSEIAEDLITLALASGSHDNITAIVVLLK